jgi:hypothetical protein
MFKDKIACLGPEGAVFYFLGADQIPLNIKIKKRGEKT